MKFIGHHEVQHIFKDLIPFAILPTSLGKTYDIERLTRYLNRKIFDMFVTEIRHEVTIDLIIGQMFLSSYVGIYDDLIINDHDYSLFKRLCSPFFAFIFVYIGKY